MRAWLKQVLRELGARGYAAYALVAEPPVPGPFRLPADAIVVALGPAAHVRLLSEPVRLAWTPEQAAQYITLSIPWTAEEAREQAEEWRRGYTEAGVPVTELS